VLFRSGSALHLAALVVHPEAQVALINRGPSQNIEDYVLQFRRFAGIDPVCIAALDGYYHPAGRRVVKRETFATLDFPAAGGVLMAAGFIPSAKDWTALDPADLAKAVDEITADLGVELAHYPIAEDG
jgi:hypothetical protein